MGLLRADVISHSQLSDGNGSVLFDGTTDSITIPSNSSLAFGTGDWTVEGWFYFTDLVGDGNGQQTLVGDTYGNTAGFYLYKQINHRLGVYYSSLLVDGTATIEANRWYHLAFVRHSGRTRIYIDGELDAEGADTTNATITQYYIGDTADTSSGEFFGYISNLRITRNAVYKQEFTVPKFKLKATPDTILLCCQSSSSTTETTVSVPGTLTANGDPTATNFGPGLKEDVTDTGVVFDGFGNFATSTYMVPPGGNTRERNRGRALFGGGSTIDNTIQSLSIQSQGNTEDFGDLSTGRYETECASSSTRGIWGGGYTESPNVKVDVVEFVTIANSSNTTDFGNLTVARGHLAGMCNSTRGVFANGSTTSPGPNVNTLDYITIATAGNATDFGDSTTASKPMGGGRSSTTRGIFTLGNAPSAVNNIEYITIASTGDSQDFGDLTGFSGWGKGAGNISSGTRAILGGGHEALNNIEYITIASLGNGTDFGDLIGGRRSAFTAGSKTRGVFGGGKNPSQLNSIEYIEIATTGNALDFGDMINSKSFASGLSDSHGGL